MDAHRDLDVLMELRTALTSAGETAPRRRDFEAAVQAAGLSLRDPRLTRTAEALSRFGPDELLEVETFADAIAPSEAAFVERALCGGLIVPDFAGFSAALAEMFEEAARDRGGAVASYIPQLARVDPDQFALSVCTVDGQMFSLGDAEETYCVQSTCKPINYAAALTLCGEAQVHSHVGREPSGRSFNELTLNAQLLPHNPMINAGAIMCAALIKPDMSLADRFDYIATLWRDLAGGRRVGFDNSVYHSERDTAHRNFALAHFMMENKAFPEGADIYSALDFYFQCCSITVDAPTQAVVAATLANGGVCPITTRRIFPADVVKNCLSLMLSCGMYDFSGEYAFTVGLPAKSGVAGALMIIVPGLCGITVWSPRLDALGNSVRGVAFSRSLVERFPFHIYANLVDDERLEDPRRHTLQTEADLSFSLLWAAARGDLGEVRRLRALGVDVNMADYDGRTALHLAASEGQERIVAYLLDRGGDATLVDRWGGAPADDARRGGYGAIVSHLERAAAQLRTPAADEISDSREATPSGWPEDPVV